MKERCTICLEIHSGECDRNLMMRQIFELREEVRIAKALDAARQKIDLPGVIMIRSLVSHRDQKPRIDIQVGEVHTQMDADSAMDVAKNIIESATGAYADAFIWHFLKKRIDLDDGRAAHVLEDFRDYRESLKREFDELQKEK